MGGQAAGDEGRAGVHPVSQEGQSCSSWFASSWYSVDGSSLSSIQPFERCCFSLSAQADVGRVQNLFSNGWIELSEDPSTLYQLEANQLLQDCLKEVGIQNAYLHTRLSTRHASAPIIYPLAKDHKPDFPNTKVRVVQPVAGSAVEKLDVIVASILSQLLPLLRYRVDSSSTFISSCLAPWVEGGHTLPTPAPILGPDHVIVSMDIESMYPSLPTHRMAMEVLLDYLQEHKDDIDLLGFDPHHITRFMQFITSHSYARACGNYYLQTTGVGTGYHSSGAYAEILVDFTYRRALTNTEPGKRPLYLGTYVDDSNSLWNTIGDARGFLDLLNNVWEGELRFTMEEPSHRRISFLDTLITITDEGKIQHQLYQKETHSGMYLPYNSHCETKTKLNIVTTEARRILRLCSSKELAWPHLETLRHNLIKSGYPQEHVTITITREAARHTLTPHTHVTQPPTTTPPLPPTFPPGPNQPTQPAPSDTDPKFILKIPYVNEALTRKIRTTTARSGIPIRVVTTLLWKTREPLQLPAATPLLFSGYLLNMFHGIKTSIYRTFPKCYKLSTVQCSGIPVTSPSSQPKPFFGTKIQELVASEGNVNVPRNLEKILLTLEQNGLYTVGLYRVNANQNQMKSLKNKLLINNSDLVIDGHRPAVLAAMVKMFFRELPEPILTFALYAEFMQTAKCDDSTRTKALLEMVHNKLPKVNLLVFERLIYHLAQVAKEVRNMNLPVRMMLLLYLIHSDQRDA
eukprot:sb/3462413/